MAVDKGRPVPPSDAEIIERSRSLCSEACYAIALQCRRLRSVEPEDEAFVFRWWADLQFLIVMLRRLQRAAELATRVSSVAPEVRNAIAVFEAALPGLSTMRNVGEHVDEYASGEAIERSKKWNSRHPDREPKMVISHRQVQVGSWNGTVFSWLSDEGDSDQWLELDIDVARRAADELFRVISAVA